MTKRDRTVTALAACAVSLGVAGAAWAMQVVGVPRPDPGALVATQALSWLTRDHVVESTFTLGDHGPMRSRCRSVAIHVGRHVEPAARLELGGLVRTLPVGSSTLGRVSSRAQALDLARLELAGCPAVLSGLIAGVVKYSTPTPFGHARLGGEPVLTLDVWTKAGRVTVYLDADTKRPLAVTLVGRHFTGRASLVLVAGTGGAA